MSVSSCGGGGGLSRVREGERCSADPLLGVGVGSRKEKALLEALSEGEGSLYGLSLLSFGRGRGEVTGGARCVSGARRGASAARSEGRCCCRVSIT